MKVVCKLCGIIMSSVDVKKKTRRREIQRKIADHLVKVHTETTNVIANNLLVATDLFVQFMQLEVVIIPELETEAIEYRSEVIDTLLGIFGFEDDDEGELLLDSNDSNDSETTDGDTEVVSVDNPPPITEPVVEIDNET